MSAQLLIYVQLFSTPWTIARQAPLSMGLFRQEYPGIELQSLEFPALAGDSLPLSPLGLEQVAQW